MASDQPTIKYSQRGGQSVLEVGGPWTVFSIREVGKAAAKARASTGARKVANVDASDVEQLDTAGALEILQLAGAGPDTKVETRKEGHAELFKLVQGNMRKAPPERHPNWIGGWFEEIGRTLVSGLGQIVHLAGFTGEIVTTFALACLAPRRFRFPSVIKQMYEVWIRALTIVGVLCFLIGVVIAYQGVQQLKQFGAETFAVDTHVFRVANRTGLAPGRDVRAVEDRLDETTPQPYRRDAHHLLILHGRYTCKARTPECWRCVVADLCRYEPKTPRPRDLTRQARLAG